jgi:hypothetical protein
MATDRLSPRVGICDASSALGQYAFFRRMTTIYVIQFRTPTRHRWFPYRPHTGLFAHINWCSTLPLFVGHMALSHDRQHLRGTVEAI